MRRRTALGFVFLLSLVLAPRPAHAWLGWLDNLSGPGQFWGMALDYRFLCLMHRPTAADIKKGLEPLVVVFPRSAARSPIEAAFDRLNEAVNGLVDDNDPTLDYKIALAAQDLRLLARDDSRRETVERFADVARLRAVPRVSNPSGLRFSQRCSDQLRGEGLTLNLGPDDRKEIGALLISYRALTSAAIPNYLGELSSGTDLGWANGRAVRLHSLSLKFTKPVFGSQWLDFQTGGGVFFFSSDGFELGGRTVSGVLLEPAGLDLHFSARSFDKLQDEVGIGAYAKRALLSLSLTANVSFFTGISNRSLNRTGSASDVSGSEPIPSAIVTFNASRFLRGVRTK